MDRAQIEKLVELSYEVPSRVVEAVPSPLVSIRTSTYNHGPYIAECIEGVLAQKTDFPIEYIIGEDFSTDGTREIVFDYAKRYPNVIRVITADRNVGSKANGRRCRRAIRGKYEAICEGDDYWTDPTKLQRQIEAMRSYPECELSFHPAKVVYADGSRPMEFRSYLRTGDRIISAEAMIKAGGGFCPTASIVCDSSLFQRRRPAFFDKAPVGDQFLQILGSLKGGALYIDRPMSVYRRMTNASWSSRMNEPSFAVANNSARIECLKQFNAELDYKYDSAFRYQVAFWSVATAKACFEAGDTISFKKWIRESWHEYPRLNFRQTVAYMTHWLPGMPQLLAHVDHQSKKIKAVFKRLFSRLSKN